ncbi:unnamed protein product [Rotaria sordida]|uniref:UDP-N-acetylenolpyruvoylglucosamine reductase C-terminal domain-containing protein n=1 Tax=Rotaria sordida TaxID=392033 RepID=A0A814EHM9_9BILA|nr:unnamed protein product [Rotaria sordida]CAF3771334.1 unnamed protein product [Rotaria sordida]
MCMKIRCNQCGLITWKGCGQHIAQVLRDVPMAQRCNCRKGATCIPNQTQSGKHLCAVTIWHSRANILINNGSNNDYDLWTLAKEIRTSVEKRFYIRLETAVNIIRIFKPIKKKMKIKSKTIHISSDKNVCVYLLFVVISLRQINIADLYFNYLNLTLAQFSRGSINIAGNTLLTYDIVRCVKLGGCQFTHHPIDLHHNLLVALTRKHSQLSHHF